MKTQNIQYDNPRVGCYVDSSCDSADSCNERTIQFAQGYGFEPDYRIADDDEDRSQLLSELADDAVDFLNDKETRSHLYWQFKDNSLFLLPDVAGCTQDLVENNGFVSSKAQEDPSEDYRGEWLHVSDHGNATLYVRGDNGQDTEIWSIV